LQFRYRGSRRESAVAQLFSLGIMDAPHTTQPRRWFESPITWIVAAFFVATFSLSAVGYFLRDFYVGTASLAPGTEIRPMGLAGVLCLSWIGSILLGGVFASAGIIMSLMQRRWFLAFIGLLVIAATWIPMFVSRRGFDYVVEVRKLVLEP
jgi:hypothetical protein